MGQQGRERIIYAELKQMIDSTPKDQLLGKLKEKARNINISDRRYFEIALLKLAQNSNSYEIRDILYEDMVSLSAIWHQYTPKQSLNDRFWTFYKAEQYKEASQICSELIKQGVDYILETNLGAGKFLCVDSEENQEILKFNDGSLQFFDPDLKPIKKKKVIISKGRKIIDVLPPLRQTQDDSSDIDKKMWILLEDSEGSRVITSVDPKKGKLEKNFIKVSNEVIYANCLSRFHGHLLLITITRIYYYDQKAGVWVKWFETKKKITCSMPGKDYYWIGISDGNVRILKYLDREGVRKKFNPHSTEIRSICSPNRFVVVSSEYCISITDNEVIPISEITRTDSQVIKCVLQNEIVISLHGNGMLVGWDLKQGNINWQINLGETYDSLFALKDRICCTLMNGKIVMFEIPNIKKMLKALENKEIYLVDKPIEKNPEAPIRHISEFTGRKDILEEIRKFVDSHFLISGGPKIGKTSLLNALDEALTSNSVCCFIDMEELLAGTDSYANFEESFITKCLFQHALKIGDLQFRTDFQRFRAMINKIRGSKKFCIFCLDNFSLPLNKSTEWAKKFKEFMTNLFIYPNSRMILTCRKRYVNDIAKYFRGIEHNVPGNRKMITRLIPLFSEKEAKVAIRFFGDFGKEQIEKVYKYTGIFPHLIQLYRDWNKSEKNIEDFSKNIALNSNEFIFEYFRELSLDANLLLATLFHEGLISKEVGFTNLYHVYPLLGQLIPKSSLIKTVNEIEDICDGFTGTISGDESSFSISLQKSTLLFQEAAKEIPWLKAFITLYKFSSNPTLQIADEFVLAYRRAARISLETGESHEALLAREDQYYVNLVKQYKDEFYIRRISEEARKALRMPLVTFIVMPLKPWVKGKTIKIFSDLYNSLQEHVRRARSPISERAVSLKFYILFLEFHGTTFDDIKKEMRGLERVSIIDTYIMKDVLIDKNPLSKSSEEIFRQLNISERSPYTTAGAVQELFYGRELEIALIRGLPENIGIFGTRTIGKTSLLLKLHRDIQDQMNWKVYALDCSGIENEERLLQHLAEKMNVPYTKIDNLEKFRTYVRQRAEEESSKYLFLLDEVDGLVAYDIQDEKIFRTFNKLCSEPLSSGESAARFIIFGFQQMYEQMNNPISRLYNFMVFLPLKSLDKESAFSLVTTPMKEIQIKWRNEEEDANYLVDNCSRYPLLLQAACHTLLTILDDKSDEERDIIEREDIKRVFRQERFQQLCMRFYDPMIKESFKAKSLWGKLRKSVKWEKEPFFEDIHKITILAAVRLFFAETKEFFTLAEIQGELKKYQINLSPGMMRRIINRLCLNGTLRLIEEPTLITPKNNKIQTSVEQKILPAGEFNKHIFDNFKVDKPLSGPDETFLSFRYEFGIKIFPTLLVANLGGIDSCLEELDALVSEKNWENWIRRYS